LARGGRRIVKARVPLVGNDSTHPVLGPLFDRIEQGGSPVPTLYRALANAPELLAAWTQFAWPLRFASHTPRALRELLILRVAQLTGAEYEWVQHHRMALEAGVDAELIASLSDWRTSDRVDELTRAALAVTDELVLAGTVGDATFAALADHLDARGLVELILTASFYCCVSRVLNALHIDIDIDSGG
jgi:AhpD family alkylhydroperoxidase